MKSLFNILLAGFLFAGVCPHLNAGVDQMTLLKKNTTGKFDVTCADGSSQTVNADQIRTDEVCGGRPTQGALQTMNYRSRYRESCYLYEELDKDELERNARIKCLTSNWDSYQIVEAAHCSQYYNPNPFNTECQNVCELYFKCTNH